VPSRLYARPPTAKQPLSGLRISITDTMPLAEVRSTLSSRAWTSLYKDAAGRTAPFVQGLIDVGVVILGKTKVSQFSTGRQWVDFPSPWSTRADGYGATYGNLAGAATALAGYEWLHRAVGHDGKLFEGHVEVGDNDQHSNRTRFAIRFFTRAVRASYYPSLDIIGCSADEFSVRHIRPYR
jgi:hypothetical protein